MTEFKKKEESVSIEELTERLEKKCSRYTKNPKYVFKSCRYLDNVYLIVLKKQPDTKTNEARKGITNHLFAKFRADKLKVIKIINIINPKFVRRSLVNAYKEKDLLIETKYEIGRIVVPDSFDEDIQYVCSNGIHYFKSIEPAVHYSFDDLNMSKFKLSGTYISWYSSGEIAEYTVWSNGQLHGDSVTYYETGEILMERTYVDGCESGKRKIWTKSKSGVVSTM